MTNNPRFQLKITKEAVNQLPTEHFPGKIVVVDTPEKVEAVCRELTHARIIGLDTETKPSFKRGVVHKVSLLQVATETTCYLFRLNKVGLPKRLKEFLSDPAVTKVGLALRDDLNGLFRQQNFKPRGFVDIQHIVEQYGIFELSLQKIYAILFGKKISKSQRLTNWEQQDLTPAQQQYAAIDAWATLQIYLRLEREPKLSPSELRHAHHQLEQSESPAE